MKAAFAKYIPTIARAILLLGQRPLIWAGSVSLIVLLTLLTQVGGLVLWLTLSCRQLGMGARRHSWQWAILAFGGAYLIAVIWVVPVAAPIFGRVPLDCWRQQSDYAPASRLYCLLNRNYVTPETKMALEQIADSMIGEGPVVYLDAGFPFFDGFPLLPHLSHRDGRKLDLSLIYRRLDTHEQVSPAWPLGYWAFGPVDARDRACPDGGGGLRWSLGWLQEAFEGLELDRVATSKLINSALALSSVRRVLIAPDLKRNLGLTDNRLRFAGCHAARHDDHIHLEVR